MVDLLDAVMIGNWHSIMDNLSDVCYLVQLIVRQVFIYLRDLILYKFFWIAATANDDFDASDIKFRGITFRNLTADILAFTVICSVLFVLVMLASKYEKDGQQLYASAGIETVVTALPDRPFFVSNTSSKNCFHACGDTICTRERIPKRNYSDEDIIRIRSSSKKRTKTIPKKSIFALKNVQSQNSQSTQTNDKMYNRSGQKWLIRKTRSGLIYGKYPV